MHRLAEYKCSITTVAVITAVTLISGCSDENDEHVTPPPPPAAGSDSSASPTTRKETPSNDQLCRLLESADFASQLESINPGHKYTANYGFTTCMFNTDWSDRELTTFSVGRHAYADNDHMIIGCSNGEGRYGGTDAESVLDSAVGAYQVCATSRETVTRKAAPGHGVVISASSFVYAGPGEYWYSAGFSGYKFAAGASTKAEQTADALAAALHE